MAAIAVAAASGTGVTGRAVLSPTCPGAVRPGERCERGYQTTIAVYTAAHHHWVKKFRSAADGHFRVALGPGRYKLTGAKRGLPRADPVTVTVRRNHFTSVTIRFDSGIR